MSESFAVFKTFVRELDELPRDRDFLRNVAEVLNQHQSRLVEYVERQALKVFAHLMFNSPGMRADATADFHDRFGYLLQRFSAEAVSAAGELGRQLLKLEEELPRLLRARILDFLVFVERDESDVWCRVDEAIPALLETVEMMANWEEYTSDFADHLRRAVSLAVQFGGERTDQVWSTLKSVAADFGDSAMEDNRIHAVARTTMEFGRNTGDRKRARNVLETLIPGLQKTIELGRENGSSSLSDGAYQCLREAYEYLDRDEEAFETGIKKIESIIERAEMREQGFDRYVQLSVGLGVTKRLKSRYPDQARAEELHRQLKRSMKAAADEGREDGHQIEDSRLTPSWIWANRYELVSQVQDPVEQVYGLATLAWFPLLDDAWDVRDVAPQVSFAERIAGQSIRIDADGQPAGVLQSDEEKLQRHYDWFVVMKLRNYVRLSTAHIARELRKEGRMGIEDVEEAFVRLELVESERVALLRRGLEALFDQDYTAALHLLVLQFESSLRRLYAQATGKELREKQGRFTAVSLSEMLCDDEFVIHPGLKRCWAVVFSGGGGLALKRDVDTGMNLRNRVAHGLIRDAGCNYANCFLVFHCLLQLLVVDPEQAWTPPEEVAPEDRRFEFKRHIPGKHFSDTISVFAHEDYAPRLQWVRYDHETGERWRIELADLEVAEGSEEHLVDLVSDVRHKLWNEGREHLWDEIWPLFAELELEPEAVEMAFEEKKTESYIPGVGWDTSLADHD